MFDYVIVGYRAFFLFLAGHIGTGWAIVALSCICSALMMPLMKAVSGIVKREAEYQDVILPQLEKIRSKYSSDGERNYHIRRLYERYSYSPLSAVKKILPLFVQIPFLLLTYYMLKGTAELSGVSFLFLKDLGRPDAMVLGFNLLPWMMTIINIVTVFSTPGFTRKDMAQAIGIAVLFLILLYAAPSALLLYWTLNNAITMVRTLVGRRSSGARLLLSRIAAFRLNRGTIAYAVFLLVLVGLYMFVTSRALVVLTDMRSPTTYLVCNWGMLVALIGAFVLEVPLLWKTETASRISTALGTLMFLGVVSALVFARFCSASAYHAVRSHMDRFVCAEILMMLVAIPLFIRKIAAYRGLLADLREVAKSESVLLLLSVALAVHYSFASANITPAIGSVLALAMYFTIPILILSAVGVAVFRAWIPGVVVARIIYGMFIAVYLIPMVSTESGWLSYDRNILPRLFILACVALISVRIRNRRMLGIFCSMLLVLSLGEAGFRIVTNGAKTQGSHDAGIKPENREAELAQESCAKKNNVYFLVYDAYAQWQVQRKLGLLDESVPKLLAENGFRLYDAYSTGFHTLASMGAAFSFNGHHGGSERSTVAGDNPYGDFLRREGYRTSYIMCGYTMPSSGDRTPGDYYYPTPSCMVPHELVLYFCVLRGIMSQNSSVFNHYTQEEWIGHKRDAILRQNGTPHFVYAHSGMPGHANREVRYRVGDESVIKEYAYKLKQANDELKEDVQRIVAADPEAIVIVASDHGPYLLMSCGNEHVPDALTLLDKYGSMLAIRWPRDYSPSLKLDCLQDVMLEVMIYLTGNRELARYSSAGATEEFESSLKIPAGCISGGIVMEGPDKGKNVFEAVR